MSEPDPALAYERLKAETAQMLKLDGANLSLVENLQVDLIAMLRLQIDDLQGQVLNGAQVDLGRLSTSLTMLRQLLPERALVAPAPASDVRADDSALMAIERMLDAQIADHKRKEAASGRCERCGQPLARSEPEKAAAEISNPGGGEAQGDDGVVPRSPPLPPAVRGEPAAVEPPKPAPRPLSDVEKMERANAVPVPQHYLKGAPEPWRPYAHLFL